MIVRMGLTRIDGRHSLPLIDLFCINWLRALKRSVIADNGKYLVVPSPFAYLQDKGIGVSKAVKTVALCARLRAWARGDATTAVVTHAWRVGSRLEACLWF